MATIRIFNDIFDDKSKEFIYDTSKPLLEQIEEHLDKDYYKSTMVECYDPDTKKTFYAPIEDEDEKNGIILFVNGECVTESYKPEEKDIVNVIFTPLSGMSNGAAGTLIGIGVGLAIGLLTGGVGMLLPALAWTVGNVAFAAVAGAALGGLIGWTIGNKFDQMAKAGGPINGKREGQQLPDVRGCSNQSLLGNNFPFVIGKHLVTPFVIGDPYTEYEGERGENAYIRELLCVGYGPLKLTDFKLGDFMLAYNQSHGSITKNTIIAGLLKGYSQAGQTADSGDIVDYWSKNDIEVEIIQQPDNAEIKFIDPYFQDRTKIDLSQRPLVSSETMNAAGWNVPSGEISTVYSSSYSNQDNSVTVLMTPINPDGTVLTPAELEEYADDCINAGSYVNTAIITGSVSHDPDPYLEPYVINSLSLSINAAIDKVIELQAQFNGNWTTVLTLPVGNVSVSLSETQRWAGTTCRLKIEEWTSAHFDANGNNNIELPEVIEIEPHPYNLLATFVGGNSIQQAEAYAQALHEDQEEYYFNRDSIGYGSIYTEVTKESVSDANIFFLSDINLDETAQVVYKGKSFPNQFRTNTVIFSEACPRQFTINLDFPSGLYATYTQTSDDSTETKYAKIPLWMCIQWRIYDNTKKSSDPKGSDYDDWNTIDFGPNVNKIFGTSEQEDDKIRHRGNNLSHLTLDDLYQGFRGKELQNFQYYAGNDGVSEFRVSATVTLTKEQCEQVLADTNPARIIEIRVLRVSPNYLNQTSTDSSSDIGPYSYSDHVKVLSTVVKTFDMEALRKDGELKPVRVVSEKDLRKLCLVAIKAKADQSGYLQNNMESITCTAESFSPIWDSESRTILPEGITKVRKYYGYFEGNTDIRTNRTNTAYERELTGPDARQQYEDARHDGFNWYMEKAGSNFPSLIKDIVYDDPVLHNDTLCWYLPDRAKKFNNNLASSGALLALFGEQEGPEGTGLEDLNVVALGEWAEKSAAVEDGTKAPVAMDYNGHHYNKGDLISVRYEANAYIYQGTKIEDLLQKLAFCGRAAWVIDEAGQVKFIMDAPVDYTKGAINAQNCISSSNSFNYEEPPAGLFITFHDENDGFENNSFYVWTDGNSAKRYHGSVEQLSVDYVTNNVQVTSLARYTLASRVQNKEILTRKIGPGGILYSLGDVILVQSDELLIGDVSGRIQEVIENNGIIYGFVMDSDYEYTAELDSSGNSVQGVTIIQPSYMGKSNAVTLPLSAPRSQPVLLDYEQVVPVGNENPRAEGWYVKDGDEYVLTTDTTVVSGRVYYKEIVITYNLQKGITNLVLFGKIDNQYGVLRDTSGDYSAKSDIKYNFKTGDIAMMGLIEKISAPYRISKIKPEAGGKFTETLIPYDESFYNYGEALPTFQSYITPSQVTETPVSLSEVPTTLKEQNDTLLPIYKTIENLSLVSYSCLLTMSAVGSAVIGTIYKDGQAVADDLYFVDYYGISGNQPDTRGDEGVVDGGAFTVAAVSDADKHKVMIYSDNTKSQLLCTSFVSFGDGSDSSSYWLIEDAASIKKDKNGTFTPQVINLSAKYQTGIGAPSVYSGRFKVEYATVQNPSSNQWSEIYTSSSNESTKQVNISSYTTAKVFRCSLYLAGGTSNLLDQDIISVVEDGQDGANAVTMTSATTPSGTYEGQVGVWQGQIYLWTNNAWVCQETNVPTDAVLHYSFDEVPDYPDGTADVRLLDNNTYNLQSTNYAFARQQTSTTLSNDNGNLKVDTNMSTSSQWTVYIPYTYIRNKVVKLKIKITSLGTGVQIDLRNGSDKVMVTYNRVGTYEFSFVSSSTSQYPAFYIYSTQGTSSFTIEQIYIGDGSYSTPIIDNANGQNNATNNGGIATKGVSGKGLYGIGRRIILTNSNFPKPTDKSSITLSGWVKHSSNYNDTGTRNLFGIGAYNGAFCIIQYWSTSQNSMRVTAFVRQDGSHQRTIGVSVTKNEWHHFAMVWENKLLTFYVDGIKYTTSALDVSDFTFGGTNWRIGDTGVVQGSEPSTTGTIEYSVDDLLIFDRALSETEVQALYLNKANTPKYYTLTDYQIEGIDDDGIVSPAEKEMLYQKWIDIYKVLNGTTITKNSTGQSGEYQKMLLRATTAGVSLDIAQGKDYVDATEALRVGLWTTANLANMSVQTKTSAGAIDNLFNTYRTAYEALSTAIDVQNKATASALSISQSNSYHQIPTDAGGSALNYVGTDDIIYLLEGESKLDCVSASTTLTAGKWKITNIAYTSCTGASTYTISDKGAVIGDLTGISADSAKRTFSISFFGNNASAEETIQIAQSFAKAKAGADGSSYSLIAEAYCVKTSTTVKFDAQKITGESETNWLDGYLFYSTGSGWTSLGQFKEGSNYKQLSLNVTADTAFRLCKSNSSTNYVDECSVKIYKDGEAGHSPVVTATTQDGTTTISVDGTPQTSIYETISSSISGDNFSVTVGTDMKPTDTSAHTVTVSVKRGTTSLTAIRSGTPTVNQFLITVGTNSKFTLGGSDANVTVSAKSSSVLSNKETVTLTLTYSDGSTETKLITITPAIKGNTGEGNKTISVVLSAPNVSVPSSEDGTSPVLSETSTTVRVYQNATELSYDGTGTSNSTWKMTVAVSGCTGSSITDSGTYATLNNITGMASDSATRTLTITGKRSDGTSFSTTVTQTLTKNKQGDRGYSSKGYKLGYSSYCIYCKGLSNDDTYSETSRPYVIYGGTSYPLKSDSNNYVMSKDSTSSSSMKRTNGFVAFIKSVSAWSANQSYRKGCIVSYGTARTSIYICITAHTSSSSITPNNATYWAYANILNVYYSYGEDKWISFITETPMYSGTSTTALSTDVILIGKFKTLTAATRTVSEIDPISAIQQRDILINEITYRGIVGTTDLNTYTSRYYVLDGNTTFTQESSSADITDIGTLVIKRGHTGTTGTGTSDSNQCMQICNGYGWETVGYTGTGTTLSLPNYLQKCQNMAMMGLVAMAKVYSANNVTLPKCCGQVFNLLIANNAFIGNLISDSAFIRQLTALDINFKNSVSSYKDSNYEVGDLAISMGKNPKNSSDNINNFIIQSYKKTIQGGQIWNKEFYTKKNDEGDIEVNVNGHLNLVGEISSFSPDLYAGADLQELEISGTGLNVRDYNSAYVYYGGYIYLFQSNSNNAPLLVTRAIYGETMNFEQVAELSSIGLIYDAIVYKGEVYLSFSTGLYKYDITNNTTTLITSVYKPYYLQEINGLLNISCFVSSEERNFAFYDGTTITTQTASTGANYDLSIFTDGIYTTCNVPSSDSGGQFSSGCGVCFYDKNFVYLGFNLIADKPITMEDGTIETVALGGAIFSSNGKLFATIKTDTNKNRYAYSDDCGDSWKAFTASGYTQTAFVAGFRFYSYKSVIIIKNETGYLYSLDGGQKFNYKTYNSFSSYRNGSSFIIKDTYYQDILIPTVKDGWLTFDRIRQINVAKGVVAQKFTSDYGYRVYANGLKILWGYCTTSGTNVSVNFNSLAGVSFSGRDSYFIWLQDCEDTDPRTRTTQGDTGGYDYVIGVDQQYTTYFCASKASARKFYWLAIGH